MELNQLMATDNGNLTVEQKEFKLLHQQVMYCGTRAVENVVEMAHYLKEIRDNKLYLEPGFTSFDEYIENAVGIKRSQVYKYITIAEKHTQEFVHSSGQIGITKLALLATLEEPAKEQIVETIDVEKISVKELKEKIKQLEKHNENIQKGFDEKLEDMLAVKLDEQEQSVREMLQAQNNSKLENLEEQKQALEKDKKELQEQVKALEEKTTKKEPTDKQELKKLEQQLTDKEKQLKEKAVEIEKLQVKLKSKDTEIENAHKQSKVASDTTLTKLNIKFEDLQKLGNELVSLLSQIGDEATRTKCATAIKTIVGSWKL